MDDAADAEDEMEVTIAACVEIKDVVGRPADVEEAAGGVVVPVLDVEEIEEIEDGEGAAEELPPAALAWYIFRRRPAPHV